MFLCVQYMYFQLFFYRALSSGAAYDIIFTVVPVLKDCSYDRLPVLNKLKDNQFRLLCFGFVIIYTFHRIRRCSKGWSFKTGYFYSRPTHFSMQLFSLKVGVCMHYVYRYSMSVNSVMQALQSTLGGK